LEEATTRPNIIILVLDAMSARNLSLYGYRRETTPHIARLAERATVYHAHYAAGNFTTPGTASILTGMYPWHHRAINVRGPIRRSLLNKHLFALVGPEYVRTAFTQNMLADVFLRQARPHLELHLPLTTFHLNNQPSLVSENFRSDPLIPFYAFDNSIVYYSVLSTMFLNFWMDIPMERPLIPIIIFTMILSIKVSKTLYLSLRHKINPFLLTFIYFPLMIHMPLEKSSSTFSQSWIFRESRNIPYLR